MSTHIKKTVDEGLAHLSNKAGVQEAEVFASVNSIFTSRINYTSHLPCNGLEEPKSNQTATKTGKETAFTEIKSD